MSDTIDFPPQSSQHQHPHQHQMPHSLHPQQQMPQSQSHPDQTMDGATPPVPQIRIASAHRSSKASATPLPLIRNPPEPYGVNEFQPKTPERTEIGGPSNGPEGEREYLSRVLKVQRKRTTQHRREGIKKKK